MAKKARSPLFGLVGGNRAAKVNPHGLRKQYKAICITHNVVLSPQWRDSEEEALQDRGTHKGVGHYIDFDVKVSG
jgi:hypothetical protein